MLEAKVQQIRRAETMNFKEEKFRHKRGFPQREMKNDNLDDGGYGRFWKRRTS